MSRSTPINVAIVGTGMSLSVFHRPSILYLKDQFNLHTVVERSGKGRATEICGEGIKVATSLDDVVADSEVDLVVISTPNNTHFPFAKQALQAGKHVLIEKPMCITAAEGEELNKIAQDKGVVLSVYQNRRWDADFLTVQKLLQSGKLGELVEFNSNYDRYRPLPAGHVAGATWKEQPGQHNDVIYNLGSHIIDQLYVLFGMPEKVGCRFTDVRKVGVDEGFLMDLYYPPGPGTGNSPFVATVQGGIMSCLPAQQRFLLKGTKGSYVKYGVDPQEKHLKVFGSRNDPQADWGVEEESAWGTLYEARKAEEGEEGVKNNDGTEFVTTKYPSVQGEYNALYANLYDVISSGDQSKLVVKPEQAIDVLRIIELGQKAAKEERLVYAKELK